MATTTKRRTVKTKPEVTEAAVDTVETEEVKTKTATKTVKEEPKKEPRQFNQNDLILCRSVTTGWLGCPGKSGQYYVFENFGDECEIEYQDLFALKSRRSNYIYAPHFIIEDEELLENPRWADVAQFYRDEVYTAKDLDEILNLPIDTFKRALEQLPKGLAKAFQVYVTEKVEDGSFDSLKKIKVIDEVYGTDLRISVAD